MKKCYSLLRWPCLLQDVLNRLLTVQNKPAAPKETITHHFFVSGIGQKKNCRCSQKFVAAQKMLLKQNPANIRKWIARFYYLCIYTPLEARVLLTIIAWVAHRYGQLYLHCSLIYFWVPSSCFCIVISLSLWGEIIPFMALPVGGGYIIQPPEAVVGFTHWLTDCFDVQPTTTNIIKRASFFSFSIS